MIQTKCISRTVKVDFMSQLNAILQVLDGDADVKKDDIQVQFSTCCDKNGIVEFSALIIYKVIV